MKIIYNIIITNLRLEEQMNTDIEMTEEKAFEQDVTTMSYEELMASIRFLDAERKRLSDHIHQNKQQVSCHHRLLHISRGYPPSSLDTQHLP